MKINILAKTLLIAVISILSLSNSYANSLKGTVMGKEADGTKTPLGKALLRWADTKVGAYAEKDGKFTIQTVEGTNKLIVTYVGYRKDTIEVEDFDNFLEIELTSDYTTGVIKIEAEQEARIISNSTIKTETITSKGLTKAACCNLSESFQTNPSVDVAFNDAVTGAKQIQLLGLQGIYIQFLTEKVPTMRGVSSNFGIEYIPGPWMESIQISKGSASVATGYESVTGQINVEYKKPSESDKFYLNMYGNDQGRAEANITSATQLTDELSTMIMAHGSFIKTKLDKNNDGFLDKPTTEQYNIINRWDYQGDHYESKVFFKGLYEDRKGGQTGYYPNSDTNFFGMGVKTQKYEFFTKNGFIFPELDGASLGTIISASHTKLESHFGKTFLGNAIYKAEQNSFYANILFSGNLTEEHDHRYVVGVSFMNDHYVENVRGRYEPKTETIPGAFIEYSWDATPELTIMSGFRADFPNAYARFLTPRFHIKYAFDENNSLRASAGKSYRIANVHIENISMFASARKMFMDEKLRPEEAWNYGLNYNSNFVLFENDFSLNAEFYRTDFQNQVIADIERNPNQMRFYNLRGKSYSNSLQVDLSTEVVSGLKATIAYRMNDVHTAYNINGLDKDPVMFAKPLQSKQKGFVNLAYTTEDNEWNFDFTAEYNGEGDLPQTSTNPDQYKLPDHFDGFALLHGQITKKFSEFELYVGGENLTNFTQKDPILAAQEPFSKYFDSGNIWGPVIGRVIYAGFRYAIK